MEEPVVVVLGRESLETVEIMAKLPRMSVWGAYCSVLDSTRNIKRVYDLSYCDEAARAGIEPEKTITAFGSALRGHCKRCHRVEERNRFCRICGSDLVPDLFDGTAEPMPVFVLGALREDLGCVLILLGHVDETKPPVSTLLEGNPSKIEKYLEPSAISDKRVKRRHEQLLIEGAPTASVPSAAPAPVPTTTAPRSDPIVYESSIAKARLAARTPGALEAVSKALADSSLDISAQALKDIDGPFEDEAESDEKEKQDTAALFGDGDGPSWDTDEPSEDEI